MVAREETTSKCDAETAERTRQTAGGMVVYLFSSLSTTSASCLQVQFELQKTDKGLQAVNVSNPDGSPIQP